MTWLHRRNKLPRNPLTSVQTVATAGRESFSRRSLTPEEGQRLVASSGPRSVLYRTALLTAYRRKTLYRLTWDRVDVDSDTPMIRPAVTTIKNRKEHPMPLRADLRLVLTELRPAIFRPSDRVFDGLLAWRGLDDLKADLAAAGIAFETSKGRMDFHALRHTASTWAGMTGEAGAVLKRFTGHKTDSQLARYVHAEHQPVSRILDRMPRFDGTHIGTHVLATNPDQKRSGETNRDNRESHKSFHDNKNAAQGGVSVVLRK